MHSLLIIMSKNNYLTTTRIIDADEECKRDK